MAFMAFNLQRFGRKELEQVQAQVQTVHDFRGGNRTR